MRVVVVPRWGGTPSDDWYPWAAAELEQEGVALEALAMPDPAQPEIEAWIAGRRGAPGHRSARGDGARRPQRRLPRRARSG